MRDPEGKVLCRTHRHQEIRLIASLQIHSRSAARRGLNDIIPNLPAVKPFLGFFGKFALCLSGLPSWCIETPSVCRNRTAFYTAIALMRRSFLGKSRKPCSRTCAIRRSRSTQWLICVKCRPAGIPHLNGWRREKASRLRPAIRALSNGSSPPPRRPWSPRKLKC